jgi:hypothetical protein
MFFAPLFIPDAEVVLWGTPDAETLPERLGRYLFPPLTPLHLDELPSRITFRACPSGEWEMGPARVQTAAVAPPPAPCALKTPRLDLAGVDELLMVRPVSTAYGSVSPQRPSPCGNDSQEAG